MQRRAALKLGKHSCRRVIGRQASGLPLHCLDTWRLVAKRDGARNVTIKCLHGHEQKGKGRELFR